jgi:hypothetical protein
VPITQKKVLVIFDLDKPIPAVGKPSSLPFESAKVYAYLQSHTDKEPDGKSSGWRCWDKGQNVAGAEQFWQDAFNKSPHDKLPYVLITNGTTWYGGAFPVVEDDALALLQKYLGN